MNRRVFAAIAVAALVLLPCPSEALADTIQRAQRGAPPTPSLDAGKKLECGFVALAGLAVQASKCNTKVQHGSVTKLPYNVVDFEAELGPASWLSMHARQHHGSHFNLLNDDKFRGAAEKWGVERGGSNFSALGQTPILHVKMNTVDKASAGPLACFYGRFTGRKADKGEILEYAYLQYCEPGAHVVRETIGAVHRAVAFNLRLPERANPASKLPTVATDASSTVTCGFVKIQGLAVVEPSVKCTPSKRTGNEGSSIDVVSLSMTLLPDKAWVRYHAEKNVSGWGFKPTHSDQIRSDTLQWANRYEPKMKSDVIGGAFRHVKVNIKDKTDWACANGAMAGTKKARGGEAMHHVWIRYCERGSHTTSDDNLAKVHQALNLD